jgi:hypothetical protein
MRIAATGYVASTFGDICSGTTCVVISRRAPPKSLFLQAVISQSLTVCEHHSSADVTTPIATIREQSGGHDIGPQGFLINRITLVLIEEGTVIART